MSGGMTESRFIMVYYDTVISANLWLKTSFNDRKQMEPVLIDTLIDLNCQKQVKLILLHLTAQNDITSNLNWT